MNPQQIAYAKRQIADLLAVYPELAEDETLRADMIEGATDVSDIVAKLITEREAAYAMAEGVKAPVEALRERKSRLERRGDGYTQAIEALMGAAGITKLPTPAGTVSISTGQPTAVVQDEAALPDRFWKNKREIDKTALNAAVRAGEEIPGVAVNNGVPRVIVRVR